MAKRDGKTKKEWVAEEVARAVNAGKPWACETVDFSDPDRPPTCIEVDFPIIPINQIAKIESSSGAGRKPIYTMNKWWARRPSSVFRSLLLSAAIKAPDDPSQAAKLVWDVYYGNHQKKGAFKHLKVADIFMGGGTTIVEGSRLGMQMHGNDLNPVAWFVVKNEMAKVDKKEVEHLLAEIEAEVKPQIMPFYTCDCPRGHKGKWSRVATGEVMGPDFNPFAILPEQRKEYSYEGPEIIYIFWAKHGPCQVTGCGHRTPIMSSPVMAVKTLTVKSWERKCRHCGGTYDLEEREARMAPGVSLVVADTEKPYAIAQLDDWRGEPESAICPHCGEVDSFKGLGKGKNKKVDLTLLVHPEWLKGEANKDPEGHPYGGSCDDPVEDTIRWNKARAAKCNLLEVRGVLPEEMTCPESGITIKTGKEGGTIPTKSNYACGSCGKKQDVLTTIKATGKTGPVAMYAIQGYCPHCDKEGQPYGGRFFAPVTNTTAFDAANREWETRKNLDLEPYWPKSEVPFGFMTHMNNGGIPNHGFTHWWKMFNPRQLLNLSTILLVNYRCEEKYSHEACRFVYSAFHRYLQHSNMFCFWDIQQDCVAPSLSNANFHPKSTLIESSPFLHIGRGNYRSSKETIFESIDWAECPWDLVSTELLVDRNTDLVGSVSGKSEKAATGDTLTKSVVLSCLSSSDLDSISSSIFDLVITDPPFGGLLHYSELADFFYVWLRLVLKEKYPDYFAAEYTPKTLEAVANRARHPEDSDGFYQRVLTQCWKEAKRILKPGGLLAFTFHHSEDEPWVSVLQSLFDAGFTLEATYPIRSDETKGEGSKPGTFGSQKIEYDIIHVCRKRREEPKPVSWAMMRREVLKEVRQIKTILEHHQKSGLPEADLQVIKRGKALEYFSRHYGKVFVDEDQTIGVAEALAGINQLLDEESGVVKNPPPSNAEPFTRLFLRLFGGKTELDRDQIQKFLRGTGISPDEYEERG